MLTDARRRIFNFEFFMSEIPKTAEQINRPQMGHVETKESLARRVLRAEGPGTEGEDLAGKPPPGWWGLRQVSGSVAGVKRAIEGASEIPAHWKEALLQDIELRCGQEFNSVDVDAHYHVEGGTWSLHLTGKAASRLL
jgi:hypothetical protein